MRLGPPPVVRLERRFSHRITISSYAETVRLTSDAVAVKKASKAIRDHE